jgi:hypothetical protein
MNGLLNTQDPQQQMPQEQMPPEQMPMEEMPPEEMPMEDEGADEDNPQFQAAFQLARQALYEGGAADNIHNQLVKSQNPREDIANITYEIMSIVDERTEGSVPDELLILLMSDILAEVIDIAESSGIQLQPADIGGALKIMINRWGTDQGYDMSELTAAMDQVSDEQINELASQEM